MNVKRPQPPAIPLQPLYRETSPTFDLRSEDREPFVLSEHPLPPFEPALPLHFVSPPDEPSPVTGIEPIADQLVSQVVVMQQTAQTTHVVVSLIVNGAAVQAIFRKTESLLRIALKTKDRALRERLRGGQNDLQTTVQDRVEQPVRVTIR